MPRSPIFNKVVLASIGEGYSIISQIDYLHTLFHIVIQLTHKTGHTWEFFINTFMLYELTCYMLNHLYINTIVNLLVKCRQYIYLFQADAAQLLPVGPFHPLLPGQALDM